MGVEEVGYEGEIEFWVASDEGCWGEELAAVELVGIGENLLSSLMEITSLEGLAVAKGRGQLAKEDCVVFAVFDVVRKILNPAWALAESDGS